MVETGYHRLKEKNNIYPEQEALSISGMLRNNESQNG
jgi:hypothetical protein